MTDEHICSLKGSGSNIVIIPLTDDSCVYMFTFTGRGSQTSERGMKTISEQLHIKEIIYTATISERNDNNIRTTSCKRAHIYTDVISERNYNNIRTTSYKMITYIHS
jgi:hypothetical protein